MILNEQESKRLIKAVQDGIATPADERRLLLELESRYKPHKIENYLYDAEEMKAEYMLAAWNAVYRAKLTTGDPIMFCIRRGNGAMLDYYRKVGSEYLLKVCPDCGRQVTHDHRNKICPACMVEYEAILKEEVVPVTDFNESFADNVDIERQVEISMMLEEVIEVIQSSNVLGAEAKRMAIEAIESREDFHTYARREGKSSTWANRFNKRILDLLHGSELVLA